MSQAHGLSTAHSSARTDMSQGARLAAWVSALGISLALWTAIGLGASKAVSALIS